MSPLEIRNPRFEEETRASFARQSFMATLGAELIRVVPGEVEIGLAFSRSLVQQNGFVHAGAITSIADSANGYAAYTLCEPGVDVLTVEFKINLLAPASAKRFVAVGRVLRPGRTLTACLAEVWGVEDAGGNGGSGGRTRIATMLSTIVTRRSPT